MRDYKYIDIQAINDQIAAGEIEPVYDSPAVVLYEALLDVLQVAESEGMGEAEVDQVLSQVFDYRAMRERVQFRLLDPEA